MKMIAAKHFSLFVSLLVSIPMMGQQPDMNVENGPYSASWKGTSSWETPEWFMDAKLGIWAHWGPQCQAEYGDWYGRRMYFEGQDQYNHHVSTYGNPRDYGLKDLIRDWKAENFDADALVGLYKDVGAKYFFCLGEHHDNFDLWDSPYQKWNSVTLGPKKDLVRAFKTAADKYGLPLGVSIHASHTWMWLEITQKYDANPEYLASLTAEQKWWETEYGLDLNDLYQSNHEHSTKWEDVNGLGYFKWNWTKTGEEATAQPTSKFMQNVTNRVIQLINDYDPDLIYMDDNTLPFYHVDEQYGLNMLAHLYNHSANKAVNGGKAQAVMQGKNLSNEQKKSMLRDIERGIPNRTQTDYWQTCTCLGDWHYDIRYLNGNKQYKTAQQVINMLVDCASKNGNLLLSVPVRADGTIDAKEKTILTDMKAWLDINGEAVFGTRPWPVSCGQGPLWEAGASNPDNGGENKNYTSNDVCYTQSKDGSKLYAHLMRWPDAGTVVTLKHLPLFGTVAPVGNVRLLGSTDAVTFSSDLSGLNITIPATKPNAIAPVFEITFDENAAQDVSLQALIDALEGKIQVMLPAPGLNTGRVSLSAYNRLVTLINDAKAYLNSSENAQVSIKQQLIDAFNAIEVYDGGQPNTTDAYTDVTTTYLVKAKEFNAQNMGSRFGTPVDWTVENYDIPPADTSKGHKNGIDKYPGYNCLYLGVWQGEDATDYDCDVKNARLYRTVHLPAGSYYFGAKYQNISYLTDKGYIFAATTTMNTTAIPTDALAYYQINKAGKNDGKIHGIFFTLQKDQDVMLGFQIDLSEVSKQEARASEVALYYYGSDKQVVNEATGFNDEITSLTTITDGTSFVAVSPDGKNVQTYEIGSAGASSTLLESLNDNLYYFLKLEAGPQVDIDGDGNIDDTTYYKIGIYNAKGEAKPTQWWGANYICRIGWGDLWSTNCKEALDNDGKPTNDHYGRDKAFCSLWTVDYEEGKGFKFYNPAYSMYMNVKGTQSEPYYFKLYQSVKYEEKTIDKVVKADMPANDQLFAFSKATGYDTETGIMTNGTWTFDTPVNLMDWDYLMITTINNASDGSHEVSITDADGKTVKGEDYVGSAAKTGGKMWLDRWNNQNALRISLDYLRLTKEIDIRNIKSLKISGTIIPATIYLTDYNNTRINGGYSTGDATREYTETDKFGTICLPYKAAVSGAKIYSIVSTSSSSLTLEPVDGLMKAGVPYFFLSADENGQDNGKAKRNVQFFRADMEQYDLNTPANNNGLIGTFSDIVAPQGDDIFVLNNNKLYKTTDSDVTINANRAYIDLSKVTNRIAGARSIVLPFDETITSVLQTKKGKEENAQDAAFDLQGRKVTNSGWQNRNLTKGIYIINGRKVVVK